MSEDMSEDIKDIIEILELAKEDIENNNENITATLDLQDLKSLKNLLDLYTKEKEKNKNKNKILRNIREEFLKYNWKDANPIQTYNQVKSLYKAIYLEPYED